MKEWDEGMKTVSTFYNHSISEIDGKYYVQFEGDEIAFTSIKEAEKFIAEQYRKQTPNNSASW